MMSQHLTMKTVFLVLLLFLTQERGECITFPEKWRLHLIHLVSIHKKSPYPPKVISVISIKIHSLCFPLPSVIIWDVLTQYDHLIQRFGGRLPCKRCGEQLHPKCWNIGQKLMCSLILDFFMTEGMVLLIGRVYVCTNKHECLLYSKAVTEYFLVNIASHSTSNTGLDLSRHFLIAC